MPVSSRSASLFFNLRHIIGALLSVLLTLSLMGCSAVKLGYNNAPELGYWWLDSYLDFNEAQSIKLRADLTALQSWHRQSELPLYVNTLEKLQRLASADVNSAQLCVLFDELRPRLQALLDQAAPTVVALAPTLSETQLEHLARQFDKRSQKWRDEWQDGSASQRNARRVKQLTDRAELFYGRLEQAQLAALRAGVAGSIFDAGLSYRESQRRQQDALQTLRKIQDAQAEGLSVSTEMRALLERALNSPDASYRNYMDKSIQESCRTFANLHNSTTPAQRLRLMETLKDYESDARALMALNR
ncbi:MAG: DUF6279 family lipoprotein [Comamonadaceae bacterium]